MSKGLTYIEYSLAFLSLATMAIIAFTNVLSRFFLNYSLAFTEEITVNLFVLLTFIGASIGVKRGAHLGFSGIYDATRGQLKVFITVIISLLLIVFFTTLVYFGTEMVLHQMERNRMTPALGWPQWIFTSMMPLGALLCIFRTIESSIQTIKVIRSGEGE